MASRRPLIVPGVAVVATVLAGCGGTDTSEPFVIGYVAPFSSELAGEYDRVALLGAEYEAARLNSRDGVRGRRIEIVAADVGDDPSAAGEAARELLDAGADVLFAAPFTDFAGGAVSAGSEAGVPVLSVAGTIPSIVSVGETAFLNGFGDNVQAAAAAEVAIAEGHRTALLVATSDIADYGDTLPVYFGEAFVSRGGAVVGRVDVALDEAPDFDRVIEALASLPQPPDLIYTAVFPPWLNDLLAALRHTGYTGAVFAADGAETDSLLAAGSVAEGVVLTSHAFTATHPTVGLLFSPRSPAERIAQFVQGFERYHGEPPSSVSFAALGADAVGVVHAAANRAGSTEPGDIVEAIGGLDRLQVTTGRTTYRGNGAVPVKVVYVLEVRAGEFRLLDVVEPADVPRPIE